MSRMKRASYRDGIDFIAMNDEADELDEEVVAGLATVLLVSELFGVERDRVARDVVRYRKKIAQQEARAHADRLHARERGGSECGG